MRPRILPIKNVARLKTAGDALVNRSYGMPGIGLVWGPTGYGKTTACTWLVNQVNGLYIRAMRLWSPKTMLTAIARELDIAPRRLNNGELVEAIVERLAETGRPLFIDEADYVVESSRLVDTLRDIHDLSSAPVILIGMHGIEKRIRGNEQFTGRIAQWVGFQGADLDDARLLADGLAEVTVQPDLLTALHQAATPKRRGKPGDEGAEVRRIVVGLGQIETFARARGLTTIGAADWPAGRDFFIGQAAAPSAPAGKVTPIKPRGVK